MKEYIEIYIYKPYWDAQKEKWVAMPTGYRPTGDSEFFEVRIPVPDEYTKNKLGTLEGEVTSSPL